MGVVFRDGRPWAKARSNDVLSSHHAIELAAVQQVAFNNREPAVQRLQPAAGANECRDLVTMLQPLSNDLPTDTARRAQYKNLHKTSGLSTPPKDGTVRGPFRVTIPWSATAWVKATASSTRCNAARASEKEDLAGFSEAYRL